MDNVIWDVKDCTDHVKGANPLDAALIHPNLPDEDHLELLLEGGPGGGVLELDDRVAHQLLPAHLQEGCGVDRCRAYRSEVGQH